MKVEIYRNLHRNCWSIRDNKTGKVIGHTDSIHLKDADLIVRQSGREKVLQEKRKNVHAFIKGRIESCEDKHIEQISYNPYKYNSFILTESKKSIFHSDHIYLNDKGEVWK